MASHESRAARLAESYLMHVASVRRCSPGTLRLYGFWLNRFLDYLGQHRRSALPERPSQVADFLRWLAAERAKKSAKDRRLGPELGSATLHKAYGVVRTFYRWAADHGHIPRNPFVDLRPPILHVRRRVIAGKESVLALLEEISRCVNPRAAWGPQLAVRDQAFFATLYFAGLRVKEACSLQVQDLELEDGYLIVRIGKGGKWRDVPLHPELRRWLLKWLRVRRQLVLECAVESPYLFVAMPGRGRRRDASPLPIDTRRMARVLQRVYLPAARRRRRGAAIPEGFTSHCLRHSIAKRLRERGMELDELQDFLGHASIETTRIYDQIHPDQLRRSVFRA